MANFLYVSWPTPTEEDPNATEDRLIRYNADNRERRLEQAMALWRQHSGATVRELVNVNPTLVKAAQTGPVWGRLDMAAALRMVNRLRAMGEAEADELANEIQAAIDGAASQPQPSVE